MPKTITPLEALSPLEDHFAYEKQIGSEMGVPITNIGDIRSAKTILENNEVVDAVAGIEKTFNESNPFPYYDRNTDGGFDLRALIQDCIDSEAPAGNAQAWRARSVEAFRAARNALDTGATNNVRHAIDDAEDLMVEILDFLEESGVSRKTTTRVLIAVLHGRLRSRFPQKGNVAIDALIAALVSATTGSHVEPESIKVIRSRNDLRVQLPKVPRVAKKVNPDC
jgi:hypothetical protein